MLKASKEGIYCDYCNKECVHTFEYYSWDIYKVIIDSIGSKKLDEKLVSVDFCESCMSLYNERIKKAYQEPTNEIIYCDVLGEQIRKTDKKYYAAEIDKVMVNYDNLSYKCIKCNKVLNSGEKPCGECGNTDLSKYPDVNHKKHVRIIMCEDAYNQFSSHLRRVEGNRNG